MKSTLIIFSVSLLFLQACTENEQDELTLFELMPPEKTGIHFVNHLEENNFINIIGYEYVYNGGGVAILDVDNDGLPDIYFTGNRVSSKLYLNKGHLEGNLQFEDITTRAGVGTEG